MKYLLTIPILMAISVLVPVTYVIQWISNRLLTLTIDLIEVLPQIDS